MNDGELLLRAILDNPADDVARLVYADWLQENDEPERAEFIRVQCELARTPSPGYKTVGKILLASEEEDDWRGRCIECRRGSWCPFHKLEKRSLELSANRCRKWFPNPTGGEFTWRLPHQKGVTRGASCTFSRGFASSISLACADFLTHAGTIFLRHPVESVRLTDRQATDYGGFRYVDEDSVGTPVYGKFGVPRVLFILLDGNKVPNASPVSTDRYIIGYRGIEESESSLSRACVLFGRAEAGRLLAATSRL